MLNIYPRLLHKKGSKTKCNRSKQSTAHEMRWKNKTKQVMETRVWAGLKVYPVWRYLHTGIQKDIKN